MGYSIPKSVRRGIDPLTGLLSPPLWDRSGNRKYQGSAKSKRQLRRLILERDEFTCRDCLERFEPDELTLGHKIPHSLGGPLVPENLRAECRPCNEARGADVLDGAVVVR